MCACRPWPLSLFTAILIATVSVVGCAPEPPIPSGHVVIRLTAQEGGWEASYLVERPSGEAAEIATGREVHVPVGSAVRIMLASRDYLSDFALPQLGLRDFAGPGLPSELLFRADRPGRFDVRSEEFCGLPHRDQPGGFIVVEELPAFRAWFLRHSRKVRT